jgi:hypothetical protein
MGKIKYSTRLIAAIMAATILSFGNAGGQKKNAGNIASTTLAPKDVLFSFVFLGCNRIDKDDINNPNTNKSTANLPELQRTFTEISALNPKPVFLFFVGDLVLGLDNDPKVLSKQLKAWVKQYNDPAFSPIAQSGIKLIAVPGNHESLYKTGKGKDKEELPWKALPYWMNEMGAFMPDGTINRVPGKDSLDNLQTYSFDYQNTHFVMLNTDTYNKKEKIGQAPAAWIAADIQKASAKSSTQHIFLLGHKPSYVDAKAKDVDAVMDTNITNIIWPAMERGKAEAMLSAHSHQYYRTQPHPNQSYQVIAGNGGSPYESKLDSAHQFFGYTIVYVLKNNQVVIKSMGRTVDDGNYLETLPANLPTTTRDSVNISLGTTAPYWEDGKL